MERDEEDKPLAIPENCPPVSYPFVTGFTGRDMSYVAVVTVVALMAAIFVYAGTENAVTSLGILIFTIAAAVMVFGRDRYAENMLDKLRILKEYRKSQKHFLYDYVNIYERVKEDGDGNSGK